MHNVILSIFFQQDIVWGAAYEINDSLLDESSALNVREKSYQERCELVIYNKNNEPLPEPALVFIGTSDEHLKLGPAPDEDIATQIANSEGPSGTNTEYLFKLAEFMEVEVPEYKDAHLIEIKKLVKKIHDKGADG